MYRTVFAVVVMMGALGLAPIVQPQMPVGQGMQPVGGTDEGGPGGITPINPGLGGPSMAPTQPPPPTCLDGISKDICNGTLRGGFSQETTCQRPDRACRTLHVIGADLTAMILANPDGCDPNNPNAAPCDRLPELNGQLVLHADLQVSEDEPCHFRGAWHGPFEIRRQIAGSTNFVVVAAGHGGGTLGVGTHRTFTCPTAAGGSTQLGQACERCWEVRLIPADPTNPNSVAMWAINALGVLHGEIRDPNAPHSGCRVEVSLKGEFLVPVGAAGSGLPAPADTPWNFAGTADGSAICACGT